MVRIIPAWCRTQTPTSPAATSYSCILLHKHVLIDTRYAVTDPKGIFASGRAVVQTDTWFGTDRVPRVSNRWISADVLLSEIRSPRRYTAQTREAARGSGSAPIRATG